MTAIHPISACWRKRESTGRSMTSINKEILKLAIPSILANITVPIVGMVDIAVAGHLTGEVATMIGGIAIGTMLFDLLY